MEPCSTGDYWPALTFFIPPRNVLETATRCPALNPVSHGGKILERSPDHTGANSMTTSPVHQIRRISHPSRFSFCPPIKYLFPSILSTFHSHLYFFLYRKHEYYLHFFAGDLHRFFRCSVEKSTSKFLSAPAVVSPATGRRMVEARACCTWLEWRGRCPGACATFGAEPGTHARTTYTHFQNHPHAFIFT